MLESNALAKGVSSARSFLTPTLDLIQIAGLFRHLRKPGRLNKSPGLRFGGVFPATFVVSGEAFSHIRGDSNISMIWIGNTLDEIDVFHGGSLGE